MSGVFTKPILNKDGERDSIVMDTSNNTISVKNENGDTLANFTNGTWEPTSFAPVDILKDSKSGSTYDRGLKFAFDDLSKEDKGKLSIYSEKEEVNNKTVAQGGEDTSGSTTGDAAEGDDTAKFDIGATLRNLKGNTDFPKDPEGFFIGRYPINQKETDNFDFLKITCYDYEPGLDLDATGGNLFKIDDIDKRIKKRRGVVSLPMQPGISESSSVGYGNDTINPLQIAGASVAGEGIEQLSDLFTGKGMDLGGLLASGANTLSAAGKAVGEDVIKAYFAGQAIGANIIGRSTGMTINNNLEVLFNGPQLRTFNYNYRFTPREPKEADKIRQIIRFFKKSMAPKRSTSRIFLKSPNVFKLKYTFKNGDFHPFLNNIKICALNNFTVDYTPDGSYSTYEDDGGRGDGSMTSYQVGMSFLEMTPIYNDDYWNDDEGKEGTGF